MDAHPEERFKTAFLSLMAQSEFEDAEKLLTENEVDVNCAYVPGGQTAMHMAAMSDDLEGIQFLLRHGANPHVKDDSGLTPLDDAKEMDAKRAVALLSGL